MWLRVLFILSLSISMLSAHPADVSQLRVRVEHERVEFRFSLNIAAIARLVTIDSNQDNKVTFAEIEAAVPAVRDFFVQSVLVSINDTEVNVGDFTGHECVWPNAKNTELTPQDAGQRFVDFTFSKPWPKGVEDVWLGFKVFERLGDLHTIQCIFQQPGEHDTPVDFSSNEPDYLYDTGWTPGEPASSVVAPAAVPASSHQRVILIATLAPCLLVVAWLVRRRQ